ncbi:MAG: ACT domain-containing protein [Mycobacteriaceae bacterium]|nr:ACT domain-containing protein [Mycobacteriaceae bacterium]
MIAGQRLHRVPSRFTVDHMPAATFPEDDEWIALVRAPEGLTVVREASPWQQEDETWVGFYGDAAGPRAGLSGLVEPLTAAGIPQFVASTYHADLVLVPESRRDDAAQALTAAGHNLTG